MGTLVFRVDRPGVVRWHYPWQERAGRRSPDPRILLLLAFSASSAEKKGQGQARRIVVMSGFLGDDLVVVFHGGQ